MEGEGILDFIIRLTHANVWESVGKPCTCLLPLALLLVLHTHSNTDGNKLMIFSGIALYYGDTYILSYIGKT